MQKPKISQNALNIFVLQALDCMALVLPIIIGFQVYLSNQNQKAYLDVKFKSWNQYRFLCRKFVLHELEHGCKSQT